MTRLTVLQKSLWLGMLTFLLVAQAPVPGYAEESSTQSDQVLIPELQLIKEEETVSIASRYEQPISQAPSNVYVITDEDIRHSGATDLPTILRRVPGLDMMQTTGAEFNVSDLSFTTYTFNIESQHSIELGSTNKLTNGVNDRHDSVDGSAVSQLGREDRLGIHVQDEWKLLPNLTAIAGVRYDLHTKITGTWSPRVALSVLNDTQKEHPLGDTIGGRGDGLAHGEILTKKC